jgi:hypothetical protein
MTKVSDLAADDVAGSDWDSDEELRGDDLDGLKQ